MSTGIASLLRNYNNGTFTPPALFDSGLVASNGSLYLYGGNTLFSYSNQLLVYSLTNSSWAAPTSIGAGPVALSKPFMIMIDDYRLIVSGGKDATGVTANIIFDTIKKEWFTDELADFENPLAYHTGDMFTQTPGTCIWSSNTRSYSTCSTDPRPSLLIYGGYSVDSSVDGLLVMPIGPEKGELSVCSPGKYIALDVFNQKSCVNCPDGTFNTDGLECITCVHGGYCSNGFFKLI